MAGELTTAQIWAALATVAALLGWSNALYKNIFGKNLGESIRKGVMKRWFSKAIFRKDVMTKLEIQQLQNNKIDAAIEKILAEVKYNGGSSIKDAVRRLEQGQWMMLEEVKHLRQLRDISEKFDQTMKFKYDPEQGVTTINEAFLSRFGCKESDVLWYAFEDLIHPLDVPDVRAKWQKAISTGTPFRDVQRIKDMTGAYHECEVKAMPVIIEGKIKEFVGVIHMNF